MTRSFVQCESHPGRPLTEHLLDVAERVKRRGAVMGDPLWCAALCHDLGKATVFFQEYLQPGWKGDPLLKAHALFGALAVFELLFRDNDEDAALAAALHMGYVRGHHGALADL